MPCYGVQVFVYVTHICLVHGRLSLHLEAPELFYETCNLHDG